jgi:hypothetical protein
MKKAIIFLRISYWIGAVLDGLMLIPMLVPGIGGNIFGLGDFDPGPEYRYAMYMGAALMAGWTVLLIWADRKPLERKVVLLITVFPVVVGVMIAGIYTVLSGLVNFVNLIPTLVLQVFLIAFFLFSYFYARSAEKSKQNIKNQF